MVEPIGYYFGLSKPTELILLTALSLWFNILDTAIFEIKGNLDEIWSMELSNIMYSESSVLTLKYIISAIVSVRAFSIHLYIALLIPSLWPMVFGTQPGLMVPWLIVSAIKNIATNTISVGAGLHICILHGPMRPACINFFIHHVTHSLPSLYMWLVGLSVYRELKRPLEPIRVLEIESSDAQLDLAVRRRMTKSLADEEIIRAQLKARTKHYVGSSALIVQELFKMELWDRTIFKCSRSLDTLLDRLAAEADMFDWDVFEPLENNLSIKEKAIQLLELSESEIKQIVKDRGNFEDNENKIFQMQRRSLIQNVDSPVTSFIYKAKTSFGSHNSIPVKSIKSDVNISRECAKQEILQLQNLKASTQTKDVPTTLPTLHSEEENLNGDDEILYIKNEQNQLYDTCKVLDTVVASLEQNEEDLEPDKFRFVKKIEVAANQNELSNTSSELQEDFSCPSKVKANKKFIVSPRNENSKVESVTGKSIIKSKLKTRDDENVTELHDLQDSFETSPTKSKPSNQDKREAFATLTSKKCLINLHSPNTLSQTDDPTSSNVFQPQRTLHFKRTSKLNKVKSEKNLQDILVNDNPHEMSSKTLRIYSKKAKPIETIKPASPKSPCVQSDTEPTNYGTPPQFEPPTRDVEAIEQNNEEKTEQSTTFTILRPSKRITLKEFIEDKEHSGMIIIDKNKTESRDSSCSSSSNVAKVVARNSLKNADEYKRESYRDKLMRNLNKSGGKFALLTERLYTEDGYSRSFDEKMAQKRYNQR